MKTHELSYSLIGVEIEYLMCM